LVDAHAQEIERRQHDDSGRHRIGSRRRVDDVGNVGAKDDEARVGDVDDVEHAERYRYAGRNGGVEPAKQ
jgi:hypothetical protein